MFDSLTQFDMTLEKLIYDCEDGNEEDTLIFMPDGVIDLETLGERASRLRDSLGEFIEAVEASGMFEDLLH